MLEYPSITDRHAPCINSVGEVVNYTVLPDSLKVSRDNPYDENGHAAINIE